MNKQDSKPRFNQGFRTLAWMVIVAFTSSMFVSPTKAYAQSPFIAKLPQPGTMVPASPVFNPAQILGMKVYPDNPLKFDFIIHKGDEEMAQDRLEGEIQKLIGYFLASLTVPEDEMWVNLSPYEKDRIIGESFGQTEMGRDLLAQDYVLKQLTASVIYPEDDLGQKFWSTVYEKARVMYGTTDIPINTFNKVWILPDKAVIHENSDMNATFLVDTSLKVLLDSDYLAMKNNEANEDLGTTELLSEEVSDVNEFTSKIVRELIIPEIEKEVNTGKNFAPLRQIYHSVILAKWYKEKLRNSVLSQHYVDQGKTVGVDTEDKEINQKIYQAYLEAYQRGVYNFIKDEYDPLTQQIIPRKYFSGGSHLRPEITLDQDIDGSEPVIDQTATGIENDDVVIASAGAGITDGNALKNIGLPGNSSEPTLDARRRWLNFAQNNYQKAQDITMYNPRGENLGQTKALFLQDPEGLLGVGDAYHVKYTTPDGEEILLVVLNNITDPEMVMEILFHEYMEAVFLDAFDMRADMADVPDAERRRRAHILAGALQSIKFHRGTDEAWEVSKWIDHDLGKITDREELVQIWREGRALYHHELIKNELGEGILALVERHDETAFQKRLLAQFRQLNFTPPATAEWSVFNLPSDPDRLALINSNFVERRLFAQSGIIEGAFRSILAGLSTPAEVVQLLTYAQERSTEYARLLKQALEDNAYGLEVESSVTNENRLLDLSLVINKVDSQLNLDQQIAVLYEFLVAVKADIPAELLERVPAEVIAAVQKRLGSADRDDRFSALFGVPSTQQHFVTLLNLIGQKEVLRLFELATSSKAESVNLYKAEMGSFVELLRDDAELEVVEGVFSAEEGTAAEDNFIIRIQGDDTELSLEQQIEIMDDYLDGLIDTQAGVASRETEPVMGHLHPAGKFQSNYEISADSKTFIVEQALSSPDGYLYVDTSFGRVENIPYLVFPGVGRKGLRATFVEIDREQKRFAIILPQDIESYEGGRDNPVLDQELKHETYEAYAFFELLEEMLALADKENWSPTKREDIVDSVKAMAHHVALARELEIDQNLELTLNAEERASEKTAKINRRIIRNRQDIRQKAKAGNEAELIELLTESRRFPWKSISTYTTREALMISMVIEMQFQIDLRQALEDTFNTDLSKYISKETILENRNKFISLMDFNESFSENMKYMIDLVLLGEKDINVTDIVEKLAEFKLEDFPEISLFDELMKNFKAGASVEDRGIAFGSAATSSDDADASTGTSLAVIVGEAILAADQEEAAASVQQQEEAVATASTALVPFAAALPAPSPAAQAPAAQRQEDPNTELFLTAAVEMERKLAQRSADIALYREWSDGVENAVQRGDLRRQVEAMERAYQVQRALLDEMEDMIDSGIDLTRMAAIQAELKESVRAYRTALDNFSKIEAAQYFDYAQVLEQPTAAKFVAEVYATPDAITQQKRLEQIYQLAKEVERHLTKRKAEIENYRRRATQMRAQGGQTKLKNKIRVLDQLQRVHRQLLAKVTAMYQNENFDVTQLTQIYQAMEILELNFARTTAEFNLLYVDLLRQQQAVVEAQQQEAPAIQDKAEEAAEVEDDTVVKLADKRPEVQRGEPELVLADPVNDAPAATVVPFKPYQKYRPSSERVRALISTAVSGVAAAAVMFLVYLGFPEWSKPKDLSGYQGKPVASKDLGERTRTAFASANPDLAISAQIANDRIIASLVAEQSQIDIAAAEIAAEEAQVAATGVEVQQALGAIVTRLQQMTPIVPADKPENFPAEVAQLDDEITNAAAALTAHLQEADARLAQLSTDEQRRVELQRSLVQFSAEVQPEIFALNTKLAEARTQLPELKDRFAEIEQRLTGVEAGVVDYVVGVWEDRLFANLERNGNDNDALASIVAEIEQRTGQKISDADLPQTLGATFALLEQQTEDAPVEGFEIAVKGFEAFPARFFYQPGVAGSKSRIMVEAKPGFVLSEFVRVVHGYDWRVPGDEFTTNQTISYAYASRLGVEPEYIPDGKTFEVFDGLMLTAELNKPEVQRFSQMIGQEDNPIIAQKVAAGEPVTVVTTEDRLAAVRANIANGQTMQASVFGFSAIFVGSLFLSGVAAAFGHAGGGTGGGSSSGTNTKTGRRSDRLGGVDLQPVNLDVQIQGPGVITAFDDPVQLEQLKNAPGLTPVLYGVELLPMPMFNMLLGANINDNREDAPKIAGDLIEEHEGYSMSEYTRNERFKLGFLNNLD